MGLSVVSCVLSWRLRHGSWGRAGGGRDVVVGRWWFCRLDAPQWMDARPRVLASRVRAATLQLPGQSSCPRRTLLFHQLSDNRLHRLRRLEFFELLNGFSYCSPQQRNGSCRKKIVFTKLLTDISKSLLISGSSSLKTEMEICC